MRIWLTILLIIIIQWIALSQTQFADFIRHVENINDPFAKTEEVEKFLQKVQYKGFPLIEDNKVTFLYRGNTENVELAGDFNSWGNINRIMLNKLEYTNLFYYSHTFERDARIEYKFIIDEEWIIDSLNSHILEGIYGTNSELRMPEYKPPTEINYFETIQHGQISSFTFQSAIMKQSFEVQVYLPPEFSKFDYNKYPSIYFNDGHEYIEYAKAPYIIDNLIHQGKIEQIVAVFIKPNDRGNEYEGEARENYSKFLVDELVPYINRRYNTNNNPKNRALMGFALGGSSSGLTCFLYPDTFGLCGMQSPLIYMNFHEVLNFYKFRDKKNVKIYASWGKYEYLAKNNIPEYMNSFTESVTKKGYEYHFKVNSEGHSWGQWKANIDDYLIYFFPKNK